MNRKKTSIVLLLVILLHIGLHLKYIPLPPGGFHLWRQTQGLAVARNFYEEGMNILKPRVDNRCNLTGMTGMEFPLLNFLAACFYKIFGFSHAGARLVVLFFSVAAIVFCYLFFRELLAERLTALLASFCLAFSPLFGYYALVMLPDIPMLALLLASLFFLLCWARKRRQVFFFLALFCLLLAGLLKISALFVVIYFFQVIWRAPERKRVFQKLIFLALTVLLVMAWYAYAMHVSNAFGNSDFRLNPEWQRGLKGSLDVLITVFFKWLPGFYLSIIQLPLFLLGLVVLAKRKRDGVKIFAVFFLAGFLLYSLLFFPMFKMHDYYMIPALPLLVLPCALGMKALLQAAQKHERTFWVLCLLLVALIPLAGSLRFIWRFEDRAADPLHRLEFLLDRVLPDQKKLVIVGCENSPSVYLYFFHRKGWTIKENLKKKDFERMIIKGAAYLICDSKKFAARPEIARYLDEISALANFTVYRLRPIGFDWRFSIAGDISHFVPNGRVSNAKKLIAALDASANKPLKRFFLKGLALEIKKAYRPAAFIFKKVIKLNPGNARAYFHLGYCCGMLGNAAAEIDAYLQAIALRPADQLSFFNLCFVLVSANKAGQAEEIFRSREMVAADPYLRNFYLGMIQGGIGEYEKALASYQQALGHQSGNELLLRNLGAIYGKLGRSREAIGVFKQAVALNEGKHLNHYLLALAYLQQGSFASAEVEFEQTLRLQPGNGLANFYQGLTCLLRHALAKSKKYFLAAKHSDVKPDAGRYFLGLLELLGQQRQSALGEYRELKRYNKEAAIELLNLIEMAGLGEIKGDALIQAALRAYAALGY